MSSDTSCRPNMNVIERYLLDWVFWAQFTEASLSVVWESSGNSALCSWSLISGTGCLVPGAKHQSEWCETPAHGGELKHIMRISHSYLTFHRGSKFSPARARSRIPILRECGGAAIQRTMYLNSLLNMFLRSFSYIPGLRSIIAFQASYQCTLSLNKSTVVRLHVIF